MTFKWIILHAIQRQWLQGYETKITSCISLSIEIFGVFTKDIHGNRLASHKPKFAYSFRGLDYDDL